MFACHSDTSYEIVKENAIEKKEEIVALLSKIKYERNSVVLHTMKEGLMPIREKAWASWNVIERKNEEKSKNGVCVTYWLNRLQNLKTETNYFCTLNSPIEISRDKIVFETVLSHPVFTEESVKSRNRLFEIQLEEKKERKLFYVGAWMYNGFHEDGKREEVD